MLEILMPEVLSGKIKRLAIASLSLARASLRS
jgi:hypothetical protein